MQGQVEELLLEIIGTLGILFFQGTTDDSNGLSKVLY